MFKCPKSGQTSSKRVLSFLFGIASMLLSFIYIFSDNIAQERRQGVSNIIITFALLSAGSQALTTKVFDNNKKSNE